MKEQNTPTTDIKLADFENEIKAKTEAMENEPIKYTRNNFAKNQFYEEGGQYYSKYKQADILIANFTAEAMYLFPDGSNDAKRLMKIHNEQNGTTLLEISSSDSVSLGKFKAAIRSKGNYTFFGTALNLDFVTTALFKEEIIANKLNTLGNLSESGIYAFANGILDKNNEFKAVNDYGVIVEDGESYFLPPFSSLYENDSSYDTQRGFKYRKGKIDLNTYASLMLQTFGKKGVIGTAYLVAALYRDIVFKHQGHFPFLYLFGSAGGGKTTFMEMILMPFIEKINHWAISINSSEKGIMRKITNAHNAIFYLKEFNSNAVGDRMVEMLKNAYDGQGYDRAATTNDNRTHQTKIGSAMVLDGNYLPTQQSALLDRMVIIDFDKSSFTEQSKKGLNLLHQAKNEGAGQLVQEILSHKENLLKQYHSAYRELYYTFKKELGGLASERTLNNLCSICAPVCTIDIKIDGFKEVLIAGLLQFAKEQFDVMQNVDEINTFWRSVESTLKTHSAAFIKEDGLYLKFKDMYPIYVRYMNDRNNTNVLDEPTIRKHITSKKYPFLIDKKRQVKKGTSNTRYMVFKSSVLHEKNL